MATPLVISIMTPGFKEGLSPQRVASAIEAGVLRAAPFAATRVRPMSDGGEGFAEVLADATGGTLHRAVVEGPLGPRVTAPYAFLGGEPRRTAVFSASAAAGLRGSLPSERRPEEASTRGLGELTRMVLDHGAERIVIGCGDTATTDGGVGMAQVLGVHVLDADGRSVRAGGGALSTIRTVDIADRDPRLSRTAIEFLCSSGSALCGSDSAVRVFAPQKGASPAAVRRLSAGLEHFAEVVKRDTGVDLCQIPGSGSCGGLGASIVGLLGGSLVPRMPFLQHYLHLDDAIVGADLVITGEGRIDSTSVRDKAPLLVAERAHELGVPAIAIVGTLGRGYETIPSDLLRVCVPSVERETSLDDLMHHAEDLLARSAERTMRIFLLGRASHPGGWAQSAEDGLRRPLSHRG